MFYDIMIDMILSKCIAFRRMLILIIVYAA